MTHATGKRRGHGEDSIYWDASRNWYIGAVDLGFSPSSSRDHVLHLFTCRGEWSGVIGVSNQNITLSLPEEDLREARILAASRGTSVSQLLARMLRELVERETGYADARDRSLARLREGMDLGTGGHIGWSRDSLHER